MQLLLFTLRVMCVGWIGVGTWHALPRRQTHLEGMGEDDPRSDCVDKERPRLEGMCFNYNRHENIVVAIPSPIATICEMHISHARFNSNRTLSALRIRKSSSMSQSSVVAKARFLAFSKLSFGSRTTPTR
jgi:hypothetical protein